MYFVGNPVCDKPGAQSPSANAASSGREAQPLSGLLQHQAPESDVWDTLLEGIGAWCEWQENIQSESDKSGSLFVHVIDLRLVGKEAISGEQIVWTTLQARLTLPNN